MFVLHKFGFSCKTWFQILLSEDVFPASPFPVGANAFIGDGFPSEAVFFDSEFDISRIAF